MVMVEVDDPSDGGSEGGWVAFEGIQRLMVEEKAVMKSIQKDGSWLWISRSRERRRRSICGE